MSEVIVMIAVIVAASTVTQAFLLSMSRMEYSSVIAAKDLAERIRTSVKIIHVANVSRTDVKFWVKNIGSSSFSPQQILMSDVFFGRVGNFQRYDYSDSGVGWNYTILGGDEDEYWECGETMEVTIHLSETLTAGDYYVAFITHNGIRSEKVFSIG
ncbi:hypothetical protein J7L06_07875 [Candidatus Bathyarchaeota archaeon]|nr:hypothetical protein [Candidatus Bathyarchaeota archaeon]